MWVFLAVFSAVLLGLYDAAKKQSLKKNGVLTVLLAATALSTLFLSPFLKPGPVEDHMKLVFKAVLVTASWISGMEAMRLLPLTTVSTVKASRPVFVVLFSILLFRERLNLMQWAGVIIVLLALYILGYTSKTDTTREARKSGFIWMAVSIFTGVASALYDKHIMQEMEPMFVQSWTNLSITVLMALCLLVKRLIRGREDSEQPFRFDWMIILVAVLITGADALYFIALKQPDALLSVVSVVRRTSVLVTFLCGAWFFREGNIKAKAINMLLMALGVTLLLIGS